MSVLGQKQTLLRYVIYDRFTVVGSSFGQSGYVARFLWLAFWEINE